MIDDIHPLAFHLSEYARLHELEALQVLSEELRCSAECFDFEKIQQCLLSLESIWKETR